MRKVKIVKPIRKSAVLTPPDEPVVKGREWISSLKCLL